MSNIDIIKTEITEDNTTIDLDGTTIGTASDVTNLGGTAAATQINNQVADVLKTDTITEHGVAAPSATPPMDGYVDLALHGLAKRNADHVI